MSASQAAVLIEKLQEKGVRLTADGTRLRFRGPRTVLDDTCLAQLRERKLEILELLRTADELESASIVETRESLVAVRIRSRSLGRDLWLARDARTARELCQDETASERLPILLYDEIPKLRGKSSRMLNALLDTKQVFPGAQVVQ